MLFAWSLAIPIGFYAYKTLTNGQYGKNYVKDLEISRKNQDEADFGMTCFYIIFGVRESSPKVIWSRRFLIPHQGYERNELCFVKGPGGKPSGLGIGELALRPQPSSL